MLESKILRIKNNPIYQQLKDYYCQSTVFSALGIERNENRHSAFLCWLLDPKSDHQLGVEPLKKFLALYAANNKNIDDELRAAFITGRYNLEDVQIKKEMSLARFCDSEDNLKLDKKQKRLDIWSEFTVSLPDGNELRKIALVIENKIYSKEGKKDDVYQTDVYHDCLTKYYDNHPLLEVFLTPNSDRAHCPSYLPLTYKQLLDYMLLPLVSMAKFEHAKIFINDYIRNLGKPALNGDDEKGKSKTYSILATSAFERDLLQELFETEEMKSLLESTLVAVYGERAKGVVGKDGMTRNEKMDTYETTVLTEFWNDNTVILKAMLHNLNIFPDSKKDEVEKIIKESNRDTTKYVVERLVDEKWVVADDKFNRPLAKGRAACVFFAQWMKKHEREYSLDTIREIFPRSINNYYEKNKWDFIDTLIFGGESDSLNAYVINKAGKKIKIADDKWDFYPLEPLEGSRCGWGYVEDGNMAVMPKMWRKEDFLQLLDHIRCHPEYFSGLRIRQIE